MDSPQFRRIFYGLLAFGFLAVTARELYQAATFSRDAIITTVFGVWMLYLSRRATKEISQQAPPATDTSSAPSEPTESPRQEPRG